MTGRRLTSTVRDGSAYLAVLLVAVVIVRAIEFFVPAARFLGESTAYAAGLAFVATAVVLWIPYHAERGWDRLTVVFFVLILTLWAGVFLLSVRRAEVVDMALVALPVAILLLWIKRPSASAVRHAVDALAWATVVLMLGVLLLQLVGVLDKADATTMREFDVENYWLPLSGLLGFDGRWIGPLRSPNVTASAAVFLVVYGSARGWRERIAFVGTGALVLLLTATRSSMVASLAGVAVLILFTRRPRILGLTKNLWAGLIIAGAVLFGAAWLIRNPDLTGRTNVWPTYLDLWRSSPVFGVGDAGIGVAVETGRLPSVFSVAHSIFIDPLARYGAVALALIVGVLVIVAVLGWRAARAGDATGLALAVALIVGGLTETLFDWRYLTFQVQLVVVAVLLASRHSWKEEPG